MLTLIVLAGIAVVALADGETSGVREAVKACSTTFGTCVKDAGRDRAAQTACREALKTCLTDAAPPAPTAEEIAARRAEAEQDAADLKAKLQKAADDLRAKFNNEEARTKFAEAAKARADELKAKVDEFKTNLKAKLDEAKTRCEANSECKARLDKLAEIKANAAKKVAAAKDELKEAAAKIAACRAEHAECKAKEDAAAQRACFKEFNCAARVFRVRFVCCKLPAIQARLDAWKAANADASAEKLAKIDARFAALSDKCVAAAADPVCDKAEKSEGDEPVEGGNEKREELAGELTLTATGDVADVEVYIADLPYESCDEVDSHSVNDADEVDVDAEAAAIEKDTVFESDEVSASTAALSLAVVAVAVAQL